MKHTFLVRFGGFVAMVGGLAAATLGLLYILQERGMTLGFIDNAVRKGHMRGR
jgi:UDP-N-acetylglucosamine:LPS N-acetylglucosamine transferase